MAEITNFQVDVIASTIAAPYGPIVRVTDMEDLPVPNENRDIEFTMAATVDSLPVTMSYEQLATASVRNRILAQFAGVQGLAEELIADVAAAYAVTNALSAPHTYEDYKTAVEAVRAIRAVKGYY